LLLLSCALSGFGLTGWRASLYGAQALSPQLEGRDVLVTGLVAGMPQWHESGLRFRLALETASAQGVAVRLPEKIDLSWYSGPVVGAQTGFELQVQPQALRAGERWEMMVRLKAPHGASNPHGFDYELWLWEQGVQATGYVRAGRTDPAPVRLADTPWYPVERLRQRLREQIFAAVPERSQAGLIAALVVGDQRAIERSDWDLFRATGVAHLMSISGLHITMFAWAAALAVGWLWRRSAGLCRLWPAPSAALLGGMLLAGAYALFSGWGVPAQRTVLMLASVGLLRLAGKRWPWPVVWLLACTVVVVADPWALLQAGFWLSFVAVGVLFASSLGATAQSEGATTPKPGSAAHAVASVGATISSVGATESTAGPPQGGLAPPGGSAARAAASVGATAPSVGATTPPPGRPKAGFAPPGGSAARAAASVGATTPPPGRPKAGFAPSGGSAARAAASVGANIISSDPIFGMISAA
jgi:competence protein ComEC